MEPQIDVRIELDEASLERDPFFLQNLEQDLQREIRAPLARETHKSPAGSMGPEIVTVIELAGLAVTALGTLYTVLQVRHRDEISFEKELPDGSKVIIKKGKLTDAELQKELARLEQEAKENKIRKLIMKLSRS